MLFPVDPQHVLTHQFIEIRHILRGDMGVQGGPSHHQTEFLSDSAGFDGDSYEGKEGNPASSSSDDLNSIFPDGVLKGMSFLSQKIWDLP